MMWREERTLRWIALKSWYGPVLKYWGTPSELTEWEVRVHVVEAMWRRGDWYRRERLLFGVN